MNTFNCLLKNKCSSIKIDEKTRILINKDIMPNPMNKKKNYQIKLRN